MVRLTRNFHVVYALVLTWSAGTGVIDEITIDSSAWFVVVCTYWVTIVGVFYDRRVAWLLSIIPPASFTLLWGRIFFINSYMFATGHEKYLDSPATIFIVFIYGAVFLLPSIILVIFSLLILWRNQKIIHQESL